MRRLCDRHAGVGADGVLELREAGEPGYVARRADLQPRRLGGRAVRQRRAPGRPVPARPRLDGRPPVLGPHGRRRDPADDPVRHDVPRGHGPRPPALARLPRWAGPTAPASCAPADARGASSTSRSATRSARSRWARHGEVDALDVTAVGAQIERSDLFPDRTNVSFFAPEPGGDGAIRARIFERGVGETASSGTGACGAAVAHVLRGGDSPVTVRMDGGELEVDVGEDLHVDLTGWAVPVFAGEVDEARAQTLTACSRSARVQRRLAVGRRPALADDQRARHAVAAGRELLLARAGDDDRSRRHLAARLDRLLARDVDDRRRRGEHDVRAEHGLAADPHALDDDAARADERAVLDDHRARPAAARARRRCPTPPDRCTSAPICAHEPTVAQVSTIVPEPTHAPTLT